MGKQSELFFLIELRTGYVDGIYCDFDSGCNQMFDMEREFPKGYFILTKFACCSGDKIRMPRSATDNFFIFLAKYEALP